jgi:response regulator of citrate/malate metabolism
MDYLLKPITADELSESLKRNRERLDSICERRDINQLSKISSRAYRSCAWFSLTAINGNLHHAL